MMRRVSSFLLAILLLTPVLLSAQKSDAANDPVLEAMRIEMERSKANLKLEQLPTPFYIDYRVTEMSDLTAEAAFGALRRNTQSHTRFLHVVVRVGDYKQDSFFRGGEGVTEYMPLDDDLISMRHQIWLATDKAYKAAAEALTQKQATLKQFSVEQPVDDFSHADPVQSIGPRAKLDAGEQPWLRMLEKAAATYTSDLQLEGVDSQLHFEAVTKYFINSEGSVVRSGYNIYSAYFGLVTQATDGMRLERSHQYLVADMKEMPSERDYVAKAQELLTTLKQLRDAPVIDEEYRGPVLFSADAASEIFAAFVGENVLGAKPQLGQPARTRGVWGTSYKTRVLPDFISVIDDPTLSSIAGQSLLGHYDVDDEGVKATKVDLVENGKLINYVVGREPIRDFPASNGHGRAKVPANSPGPSLGNLIVRSSEPVSAVDLKKKLIELCRQRELPYGYYVETLGPLMAPRLVYKVYVKDGHQELVRGAVFGDLDLRALRNDVVAAGDDVNVQNFVLNIPHSIANPSILFDELQIKRSNANNQNLPEYPAPGVTAGK